jgi:hypothetical protein
MAILIRRREFITALGSAATWPLAARAQQPGRMRLVAVLMGYAENDPAVQSEVATFRGALAKLGWTEGSNLRIELRWGAGNADKVRTFAKELVDLRPDVILGQTTVGTDALARETKTIPIVFVTVGDPIASGFTTSLARPSGNSSGRLIDDVIQTDAALNPGNSGGPLVSSHGEVVGINTAVIMGAQGICFAVASNTANFVLGELVRHGRVRRAYIGVAAQQSRIPRRLRHAAGITQPSAVMIATVEPGSPAARGGLHAGDIILALDGVAVTGADDLIRLLAGEKIGRTVAVDVLRSGSRHALSVVPDERARRR